MSKAAFLSIAFILATVSSLCAQTSSWGAFSRRIDAKPFAGKRFRLEGAVRVEPVDSGASASVWVRVDKDKGQIGFFRNGMDQPARSARWELRTISGKIDRDAQWIVFGGLYNVRGRFWFDAFRLYIESGNGYEEMPLRDGGFESDSTHADWSYRDELAGYVAGTAAGGYEGQRSFFVDGSLAKRVYGYGSNDSLGRYFARGATRIYYEEYGSGEPLLLLHGNRGSIADFKAQIPEFAKQYRVIAVDSRGQGRSTEDGRTYTYDLFADDMAALLDHLHLDSVRIVGWSDGGNTALIMAMKYPKKVKALAAMGANVFIDKTVVGKWVFRELDKQEKEGRGDTGYSARNELRFMNLLRTEPRHSFADLESIRCPVLVLAGEKDIIREEHTRGIAAHIPGATLYIAPKETHYFPAENPKAFNAAVFAFFAGRPVGR